MKKVAKSLLLAALSCAVLSGCQDLNDEQDELFQEIINSEEITVGIDGIDVKYPPLEIIKTEPEILDDANINIKLDFIEEKSGHWINHIVNSNLPGNVAQAIQSGEIDLILGAWENEWVEYKTSDFWRDDWQLIKFDAPKHYLPYFSEVVDKTEKVHDFSDCLSAGTYYLKAEYNGVVYKGYFELALPTVAKEYIESVTYDGITVDSSNVLQFPLLLEDSLDKTSTENKVVIAGALTTEEFRKISAYLRSNDKYISEIDLSGLDLENFPSSNQGAGDNSVFYQCKNLKKVVLPSNLKVLGEGAFTDCTALEEVVLPSTLEEIEWSAFCYCNSLKSILIPASVKIINQTAFYQCYALEEVVFEEGSKLEKLGARVFYECKKLTSFTFPPSISKIVPVVVRNTNSYSTSSYTFDTCQNLKTITLYNTVKEFGINEFSNCNISTINFYGTEEEWKAIKNKPSRLSSATVNFITE